MAPAIGTVLPRARRGLYAQPLLGEDETSSHIAVLFSWDGSPQEQLSMLISTLGDSTQSIRKPGLLSPISFHAAIPPLITSITSGDGDDDVLITASARGCMRHTSHASMRGQSPPPVP